MSRRQMWTCVIDFRGGTYVRQIQSPTPGRAFRAVLRQIGDGKIPRVTRKLIENVIEDVRAMDKVPVALEGMQGVFCATALLGKHLLLVHLVKTAI